MERLLLIEDDLELGQGLVHTLDAMGYETAWATSGQDGLASFRNRPPDLLLLDLSLPDRTGLAILRDVRQQSMVPVIILTGQSADDTKVRGLDDGADDYITKPFAVPELLARIRANLRRVRGSTPDSKRQFGALTLDLSARTVTIAGKEAHFTPTEFGLLTYLVEREGCAVSRDDLLADVLQGEDSNEQALHTHVSRIRRKLGPAARHLRTVWGIGYRFDSKPPGA